MSLRKLEKKKNVWPKSEVAAMDISHPYDFKHDFHLGKDYFAERPNVQPMLPTSTRRGHSFREIGTQTNPESMKVLKTERMFETQHDVSDPITFNLLWSEIQEIKEALKGKSHSTQPKRPESEVRGRSETNIGITTETGRVIPGSAKFDGRNHDPNKLRTFELQTHNQHIKTNEQTERQPVAIQVCTSDMEIIQHKNKTKTETKLNEFRSNSFRTRVKPETVAPRPRSAVYTRNATFDERECLANALRFHIKDLVDGIIFQESELPDYLLAKGCLTDDECSMVRKWRDRKDQIRVLISLVKGRDLNVLKRFVSQIRKQNPDVAEKIYKKFEENKRNGVRGKLCIVCKLEKQFDVKHVADGLWAIGAIDDELYNRIIYSEAPLGAQSTLWKEVIVSLNSLDRKIADTAQGELIIALSCKNLFTHLASGIKEMLIKNHGKLTCACEPKLVLPKRNLHYGTETSGSSLPPDSSSDGTSNDIISVDGTENEETSEKGLIDGICGMSSITEVTEVPMSPGLHKK